MSLIDRELLLMSVVPDSIDVQPRGEACFALDANPQHEWCFSALAAGFKYEICGRCGTVRIHERH